MKTSIIKLTVTVAGLMVMAGVAQASLLQPTSGTLDMAIPDGSPVGIANSLTVSGSGGGAIEDVSVNLNISGGYAGDLYGYLLFQPTAGGPATMDVLLNQIGTSGGNPFGDTTAGMNVTLSDSGTGSIHDQTGTALTSGTGVYTPDSANTLDATFANGQAADGTWTLFLADLSSGGGTSQLVSWGVNISVVPEPIAWALIVFATLALALRLIFWLELKARGARFPGSPQNVTSKGGETT